MLFFLTSGSLQSCFPPPTRPLSQANHPCLQQRPAPLGPIALPQVVILQNLRIHCQSVLENPPQRPSTSAMITLPTRTTGQRFGWLLALYPTVLTLMLCP